MIRNLLEFECINEGGIPLCVIDSRPQCASPGVTNVQALTNTVI